jgi:23S rRNA pseudouridine2605 synthase
MSPPADPAAGGVRLQKVLAAAGLGSRRAAEALIAAGRVQVNGHRAVLGDRVDPARDVVKVDGDTVPTAPDPVYLALNKPLGVLSTMSDDRGRPCVGDLVADIAAPVHHVGRLDADSEGLLLVTNDGPLSHRLTHPSYGVLKRYVVEVEGVLPRAATRQLREGVELEDGLARADELDLMDATREASVLEIALHEGRQRIVRRMFDHVGHPVTRLVRIAVGPIRLGSLKSGRHRHLQLAEIQALYRDVDL